MSTAEWISYLNIYTCWEFISIIWKSIIRLFLSNCPSYSSFLFYFRFDLNSLQRKLYMQISSLASSSSLRSGFHFRRLTSLSHAIPCAVDFVNATYFIAINPRNFSPSTGPWHPATLSSSIIIIHVDVDVMRRPMYRFICRRAKRQRACGDSEQRRECLSFQKY